MLIDNDGQFLKFPLSHFIYHVEVKDGGTLLHHNLATSNFPFFLLSSAMLETENHQGDNHSHLTHKKREPTYS